MDSPSLRQLDIFAQMMAAGSASRCAADMGITVEQVLGEIASLEQRLGFRLFDNHGGEARLTAAGRKTAQAMTLLTHDAPVPRDDTTPEDGTPDAPPLAEAATIVQPASLFAEPVALPPRQTTITLGAPAAVFIHFQDALAAFEAANDDIAIAIDLHVHNAREARSALNERRIDIAYFYALEEPDDFASRYGWSEPVSLYAGERHALARADSVSREMLARAPMLALDAGNPLRPVIDAAIARGRLHGGAAMLESDTMVEILATLRDGTGWFAAFGSLARDLGRMQGVRRLALDIPLPAIEVRQATGPSAADKPAVQALSDFLFL